MRRVAIAEDGSHAGHVCAGHPERPDRVEAIRRHLSDDPVFGALPRLPVHPVDDDALLRVHTRDHLAAVAAISARGGGRFDADTYATATSDDAARHAAGGAVAAVAAVAAGDVDAAFAVVRPPGHHATAGRAMGFCLYNNVAVAVEQARAAHGVHRAAIVDIDVHHGNGTEAAYWNDGDLLYASLHQFPFYPGTGAVDDRGGPQAHGATVNIPLPAGTGGAAWLRAFDEVILPALEHFAPDLVVVSCGFDAHQDDPLAELLLTTSTYADVAARLTELRSPASGRSAWVLEGGYNLGALVDSSDAVLRKLLQT